MFSVYVMFITKRRAFIQFHESGRNQKERTNGRQKEKYLSYNASHDSTYRGQLCASCTKQSLKYFLWNKIYCHLLHLVTTSMSVNPKQAQTWTCRHTYSNIYYRDFIAEPPSMNHSPTWNLVCGKSGERHRVQSILRAGLLGNNYLLNARMFASTCHHVSIRAPYKMM